MALKLPAVERAANLGQIDNFTLKCVIDDLAGLGNNTLGHLINLSGQDTRLDYARLQAELRLLNDLQYSLQPVLNNPVHKEL